MRSSGDGRRFVVSGVSVLRAKSAKRRRSLLTLTTVSHVHFHLQGLGVIRSARLAIGTHLLLAPCLQLLKSFVDIHFAAGERVSGGVGTKRCREEEVEKQMSIQASR